LIEERLLKQLQLSQFDELGMPVHEEMQRICGRVINTSTEDDKLKIDSIGLFNIGELDGAKTYKLKLNLNECKEFSLFEGEVVVAEGFNDSQNRFNVCKIHKPVINPPAQTEWNLLKSAQEAQQNKVLHIMAAVGPYTS